MASEGNGQSGFSQSKQCRAHALGDRGLGRAEAAAHEEAPISSGKALSMRPLQMRGVLRPDRATDPWPT